jgi:tetratricopeptide (TPR) repeat protein
LKSPRQAGFFLNADVEPAMSRWLKGLFSFRQSQSPADALRDSYEQPMQAAQHCYAGGDPAGAERLCREILDEEPDYAPALCLLGEMATARGDHEAAAGLLRRAISIAGDRPHYHYALGCILGASGDFGGAEQCYRSALTLAADHAPAHINLGCILQGQGESGAGAAGPAGAHAARQLEEALRHFRAATELAPASPDGWINLGFALAQQRLPDEARHAYDRAIAVEPDNAHARLNRAMALLALGRWSEAWDDYEWRWAASGFPRPVLGRPEWDGSALAGKTILLYTEQGFGDAIQFVRYAPLLAERGARVALRCQPELTAIFSTVPGVAEVISAEQPAPEIDVHCSLLGVPRLVGTTIDSIPGGVPYLSASAPDRGGAGTFRVGLVWASQSLFPGAALKSLPPVALAPLSRIAGVEFCSLQMGAAGSANARGRAPLALRDMTAGVRSFADTAALVAGLDLTISVDTAVAHLAGAMGMPVWTLLPYAADWRWEPDGPSSRWYPSMRLFRQQRRGDWGEVMERVADQLDRLARTAPNSRT